MSHICRFVIMFFFFNDPAPTEIYTLSLHDALPISGLRGVPHRRGGSAVSDRRSEFALDCAIVLGGRSGCCGSSSRQDRKSTRLNSSHSSISYAVFCLKKKKQRTNSTLELAHMAGAQ